MLPNRLNFDPGLTNLREAALIMAATLASFASALLIKNSAQLSTSVVILAVALSLSLGRRRSAGGPKGIRRWGTAVVVLPVVAVIANEIGSRVFSQPNLGDALFVAAISATIWVRRFGPRAKEIATFATFPLVAMLIVPAPIVSVNGSTADSRWWSALIAVIALSWVTVAGFIAERTGFVSGSDKSAQPEGADVGHSSAKPAAVAQSAVRATRRMLPSTKMALQMAAALAAAFAIGRSVFGVHWTWVVLTAFIVCSGNRGRGDVLHKAAMRVAGAAAGTLVATVISGAFAPGDQWSIVLLFVVLGGALWLRPLNYAFWAAGMTAALALLYGYYGDQGAGILASRLEAILIGAALGVICSWVLLPVRTTDVIRRDIGSALRALDDYLVALTADPAGLTSLEHRFLRAMRTLEHASTLMRAVPARLRSKVDYLPALRALERCAAVLPAVTAAAISGGPEAHWQRQAGAARKRIGELRRGNAKRGAPDAVAWQELPEVLAGLPAMLSPAETSASTSAQ